MSPLERLRAGEVVCGLFQTVPEASFTELAVWCGYDFVILDREHGVFDDPSEVECLRAFAGSNTCALIRTQTREEGEIARHLDFGAHGVMVPDVRSADEAHALAFAAARRWTGGLRFDRYGLGRGIGRPLVLALIESPEGVANVESILDIEGIDGVIPGPGDLSTRLGAAGDFSAPAYVQALERVERAARERGKVLGAKPYADFTLPVLMERGYRFFITGRDMILMRDAFGQALSAARALLATGVHPHTHWEKPE
jgi:2-keto-3-deoxy-L-rhamnonate aldolase RhmA